MDICSEMFQDIENHKIIHPWSEIILHHSATKDGKVVDWGAIDRYHRSFRMNFDTFTPAINIASIKDDLHSAKYVEFNGNYYVRQNVEDFYKKVNSLSTVKIEPFSFVNQTINGVKIETPDRCIGYNYGIEIVGDRFEYQVGRSLDIDGAHCVGKNRTGIGLCILGTYDPVEPVHQQYFLLACVCRAIMKKFSIAIDHIYPHSAFAKKTCPGLKFDLAKLKTEYIHP
jgi:hypothetical protein